MRKMNAALSFSLIVVLSVPALSLSAEGPTETPKSSPLCEPAPGTGPLANAATRDAARLAASTNEPTTPVSGNVAPDGQSGPTDWSAVRALEQGEAIVLTSDGTTPTRVYLLHADDNALTVLDVSDPAIPASAKRVLVDIADNPNRLMAPIHGAQLTLGKNVRLTPNGVFIDDRKVADLEEVIKDVPRSDVVEISRLTKHVRRHVLRGALIGAAFEGVIFAAAGCSPACPGVAVSGVIGGAAGGALIGSIVGGLSGRTPEVIYRAR